MIICPRCKAELQDGVAECNYCGSPAAAVNNFNQTGNFNMQVQPKNSGFAITSMVLGIVSVPLICCCYIGAIPAILAVIFGFIARNNIINSNGREKGNGMALAGIVLGFCTVGIVLLLVIIAFANGSSFSRGFSKGFFDSIKQEMEKNNSYQ